MTLRGEEGLREMIRTEQNEEIVQALKGILVELDHLRTFRNALQKASNQLLEENRELKREAATLRDQLNTQIGEVPCG